MPNDEIANPPAEPAGDALRDALNSLIKAARTVDEYLREYGPDVVPHLIDSDDNPGQRMREAIEEGQAALAAAPAPIQSAPQRETCPNKRHHYDMATPECPLCGAFQGDDAPQTDPVTGWYAPEETPDADA